MAHIRLRSRATGTVVPGPGGSVTVLAPTVEAVAEVPTPTIDTRRAVAAYFEHLLRTYPPTSPDDHYVVELVNPDTGLVDIVIHEDRAEALRRLAEPFAEDL